MGSDIIVVGGIETDLDPVVDEPVDEALGCPEAVAEAELALLLTIVGQTVVLLPHLG